MEPIRCHWAANTFEQYIQYHDQEWGVPVHDDVKHFEFLILESAQAGLSWSTILKKRAGYQKAFADFNPELVASFGKDVVDRLVEDPCIIRNRAKIEAAINNARRFLEIKESFGSFDQYIWSFVNGKVLHGHWTTHDQIPATTKESVQLAKDLKKRGFKFLGPTTVYAHMQATGLVNDHTTDCFRYQELIGA